MVERSISPNASAAVHDATRARERAMQPQRVPVRMYEASGALVILAPFPAVTADDVRIELEGGRLRMAASLRSAPERDYLLDEWEFGGYEREVDLPEGYRGPVEAMLSNGQLVVRVLAGEAAP